MVIWQMLGHLMSFGLMDNFSHCGVNSFQLFNDNGQWKIIYLIDTRRKKIVKD